MNLLLAQTTADVPVPRDIPMDLPVDPVLMQILLVVLFVAHILFVNMMLGGTLLTVFFQTVGYLRGQQDYDSLAHELATTVTVNKSLAVVLGVAPLLGLNVMYTLHFYTANALTGTVWMAIVPLTITAFLLLYLHKFTWERLAHRKLLHISIAAAAGAIFLVIPLIFLTNINLMLFPEKWAEVKGFASAMMINSNVLPRYFHFLLASFAATGLFGVWYFGRRNYHVRDHFQEFTHASLMRKFYKLALFASLAQFAAGPLVLFTLPYKGLSVLMLMNIGLGIVLACAAMALMYREIAAHNDHVGRHFWTVAALLAGTVIFMAFGRHLYREEALREHQSLMATATKDFVDESQYAAFNQHDPLADLPADERAFKMNCASCHQMDSEKSAPSLREIAKILQGKPDEIVAWAKNPSPRKRTQYNGMPSMKHVSDEDLKLIADYMLRVGTADPAVAAAEGAATTADQPAAATATP